MVTVRMSGERGSGMCSISREWALASRSVPSREALAPSSWAPGLTMRFGFDVQKIQASNAGGRD